MNINSIHARFEYSGIRDVAFPLKTYSINKEGEAKANFNLSDYSLQLNQDFSQGTLMKEAYSNLEQICSDKKLELPKSSMQVEPEVNQLKEPWSLYLVDTNSPIYRDVRSDYLVEAEMMIPGSRLKAPPPEKPKKMRKHRLEREICSFASRSLRNGAEYQRFPFSLIDFQWHLFNEENIVQLFQEMCDNQRPFDHSARASLKVNVFQRLEGHTYLQAHYRSPYFYDSPYGVVTMRTRNS